MFLLIYYSKYICIVFIVNTNVWLFSEGEMVDSRGFVFNTWLQCQKMIVIDIFFAFSLKTSNSTCRPHTFIWIIKLLNKLVDWDILNYLIMLTNIVQNIIVLYLDFTLMFFYLNIYICISYMVINHFAVIYGFIVVMTCLCWFLKMFSFNY